MSLTDAGGCSWHQLIIVLSYIKLRKLKELGFRMFKLIFLSINAFICMLIIAPAIRSSQFSARFYIGCCAVVFYLLPSVLVKVLGANNDELNSVMFATVIHHTMHVPIDAVCTLGLVGLYFGLRFPVRAKLQLNLRRLPLIRSNMPAVMICVLWAVAMASTYLFTIGFGSIENAIQYSAAVRSGYFKEIWTGDVGFLFFKRFIFFFLPVLCFSGFFIKSRYFKAFLIFTSVAAYGLFLLLLNHGRQAIIDLFLIYIISMVLIGKWHMRPVVAGFGFVALFALLALDSVLLLFTSSDLQSPDFSDITERLLIEFSGAYLSVGLAWQSEVSVLGFYDFYTSIFGNFLPVNAEIISNETNMINSRAWGSIDASYPPGIFAYGLYNLSIFGVILYAFFMGIFFQFLDKIGVALLHCSLRLAPVYAYIIVTSLSAMRTGAPRYYFYEPTNVTFLLFMLLAFSLKAVQNRDFYSNEGF